MTQAKVTPSVREEVLRLLSIVPSGLAAAAMAQISRLQLSAVEAVLAELDLAGDVVCKQVVLRGEVTELWARR